MEMFSIEFWVVLQMVIQLLVVLLLLFFARSIRAGNRREIAGMKGDIQREVTHRSAGRVVEMMEPLLKDAEAAAKEFDVQIREKNRIIRALNERLDRRIISLNLLLNRADACLSGGFDEPIPMDEDAIYEQQDTICQMHRKGLAAEAIAGKLSVPQGEVELVLELKKKFLRMEESS